MGRPKIEACGFSDRGQVRTTNQDAFYVDDRKKFPHIYAVCDGMGGMYGGEQASKRAVEILKDYKDVLKKLSRKKEVLLTALEQLVVKMDQAIVEMSEEKEEKMGTTLALLYIDKEYAVAVNVGDSRIYHINELSCECVTEDDNLCGELLRRGLLNKTGVRGHQGRYQLTQFLGIGNERVKIIPHIKIMEKPQEGDVYLICSDGLNALFDEKRIVGIKKEESIEVFARGMIEQAGSMDGSDNMTVIVARVTR